MNEILVVGSMAFDTVETPFGKEEKILGGSANYFSIAASYFSPINLVGVVGDDFPKEHITFLNDRNIDTNGLKVEKGNTFHWKGRYGYDLNEPKTLETCLNVFEKFSPTLTPKYKKSEYLFLGNIDPDLQMHVLKNMDMPKVIAMDTMNFWISGKKQSLLNVLKCVDILLINESETRQLSEETNLLRAAMKIIEMGPETIVIKKGENGALLVQKDELFYAPGLPLDTVVDPTGAGDSFAGGFMGYLAGCNEKITPFNLRKAVLYGSVMASYVVEDFSFRKTSALTKKRIEERFDRFVRLTHLVNTN